MKQPGLFETAPEIPPGTLRVYNEDCAEGCKRHIEDGSVDLIITDPPYGIGGDSLHKHYNRKEEYVLGDYAEVPRGEYAAFSERWIQQAERILRPGGSIYIVSGHTNLADILNALRKTRLRELNHIVWKYNFGVYTSEKYVTSHYHILFLAKPGAKHTFNTHCRYGPLEKNANNGSLNYLDREDVWIIPREYKPGRVKNKNELPTQLLIKMMQYSSNEGDVVCDLFLGGFSTARVAIGLNRKAWGFEISRTAFEHNIRAIQTMVPGGLLDGLRIPAGDNHANQGKPWTDGDLKALTLRYDELFAERGTKRDAINALTGELGRGYFSVLNALKRVGR